MPQPLYVPAQSILSGFTWMSLALFLSMVLTWFGHQCTSLTGIIWQNNKGFTSSLLCTNMFSLIEQHIFFQLRVDISAQTGTNQIWCDLKDRRKGHFLGSHSTLASSLSAKAHCFTLLLHHQARPEAVGVERMKPYSHLKHQCYHCNFIWGWETAATTRN